MRALVIGAAGQDGSFLCEQLEAEGAQVFTLTRQGMNGPVALDRTPIMLSDRAAMMSVVKQFALDQIYYLAAYHHSAEDRLELEVDRAPQFFGACRRPAQRSRSHGGDPFASFAILRGIVARLRYRSRDAADRAHS